MRARVLLPGILLAFFAWMIVRDHPDRETDANPFYRPGFEQPEKIAHTPEAISSPLPGKSSTRPSLPSVTEEDTLELLRETIIPHVSYPEQTLLERTNAINRQLQEAAVSAGLLRITLGNGLASQAGLARWKFEPLELRNVSIAEILKYTAGRTKVRYHLRPGIVEWALATEQAPDATEDRRPLQHAEGVHNPGEDDPFGLPPAE